MIAQSTSRPSPILPAGVSAVLALLTLAGCGGSSTPPPTKAQFRARAEAVCRREAQALRGAAAFERAPLAAFTSVPRLIRQAVALRELADSRLESLQEPAGEASAIQRWLTARTVAATLQRDAAEAPPGKFRAAATDLGEAVARAEALARRLSQGYGPIGCSE